MSFWSAFYLFQDIVGLAFISMIIIEWGGLKLAEKFMASYVVLDVLVEVSAVHVDYVYGSNLFAYAIFSPPKFALIFLAYAQLNKNRRVKFIYYGLILLSSISSIVEQVLVKKEYPNGEYHAAFFSVILIVCSYLELRKFILNKENIDRSFVFWMTITFFVFYSITTSVASSILYIFNISPELASDLVLIIKYMSPAMLFTQFFGFLWSTTWNKSYSS